MYFAHARILRVPKEGRGKSTSGVFGKFFVCAAGMLAVPIKLQYRFNNQHKQLLNITCTKCMLVVFLR